MDERREELLSAYVDGELTPDERAEVERWLAESSEARQVVEDMRALGSSLGNLARQKLTAEQSSSLIEKAVQARAAAGATGGDAGEPRLVANGAGAKAAAERVDIPTDGNVQSTANLKGQASPQQPVTLRAADETAPAERWRFGSGGMRSIIWPLAALAAGLLIMFFNRQEPNESTRQVAVAPPVGGELSARDGASLAKSNELHEETDFDHLGARGVAGKDERIAKSEATGAGGNMARSAKVAGSESLENGAYGVAAKGAAAPAETMLPNAKSSRWSALSNSVVNTPAATEASTDLYALEVNGVVKPAVQTFTCEVSPEFLHEQRFEKLLGDLKVEWQPAPTDTPVLYYQAVPPATEPTQTLAIVGAAPRQAPAAAPADAPTAVAADKKAAPAAEPATALTVAPAPLAKQTEGLTQLGDNVAPGSQSYVVVATPEQLEAIVKELRRDRSAVPNVSCVESPPTATHYFIAPQKDQAADLHERLSADGAARKETAPAAKAATQSPADLEKRIVRLRQAQTSPEQSSPTPYSPTQLGALEDNSDAQPAAPKPGDPMPVSKVASPEAQAEQSKPAARQKIAARAPAPAPSAAVPAPPAPAGAPSQAADTQARSAQAPAKQSPEVAGRARGAIPQARMLRDSQRSNDERSADQRSGDEAKAEQTKVYANLNLKQGNASGADRPVVFFTLQPQALPNQAAPANEAPAPTAPLQKARAGGQP